MTARRTRGLRRIAPMDGSDVVGAPNYQTETPRKSAESGAFVAHETPKPRIYAPIPEKTKL